MKDLDLDEILQICEEAGHRLKEYRNRLIANRDKNLEFISSVIKNHESSNRDKDEKL